MFKRFFKKTILLWGWTLPVFKVEEDEIEAFKTARGFYIEDDWERVKSMFQLDNYGNIHPELEYSLLMAQTGLFAGAFMGGTYECIRSTQEFIRNNDANIYWTRNEALRKLNYASILGFSKGAWKYAPKYCFFFAGFSIFSSCCELYRNKSGIIENTVGGAGVGAILKSHLGIKGALSGGVVGGILGTIYGLVSELIHKLSNKGSIELKYTAIAFSKYKKELKKKACAEEKEILKEKEVFEKRFSEKNEDKTDRLKQIVVENTAPPSPAPAPASTPVPDPVAAS